MLRGLWKLTWLEIKIFVREPLGVIGTVGIPVVVFVVLSRLLGPQMRARAGRPAALRLSRSPDLRVHSDRRKRGAVPHRDHRDLSRRRDPQAVEGHTAQADTILTAHVVVKLLFTAITLASMMLAGRRYLPLGAIFRWCRSRWRCSSAP